MVTTGNMPLQNTDTRPILGCVLEPLMGHSCCDNKLFGETALELKIFFFFHSFAMFEAGIFSFK